MAATAPRVLARVPGEAGDANQFCATGRFAQRSGGDDRRCRVRGVECLRRTLPPTQPLAESGLRFNRFHSTAMCSPTGQALLTGRNHHAPGMGGITEIGASAPAYDSVRLGQPLSTGLTGCKRLARV